MIDSISEIFTLDWSGEQGILEEISGSVAERLINNRMPFCIVDIQEDSNICFEAITEYDSGGLVLNFSERSGVVTEQMKGMEISDVFYHEGFANDGYLVYLDSGAEKTLYGQVMEEKDLSCLKCYLCGQIEMSEILKLPEGVCVLINCGNFMQKLRETPRIMQERNRNTGHR